MKKKLLFLFIAILCVHSARSQWILNQYFDGADTLANYSFRIHIDTTGGNVWQIGRPQKTIFDSAATNPNALITDTINAYPANDTSSFTFGIKDWNSWGILAIRWKQKLDFDKKHDGGIIEYSLDTGTTWHNVFNNPFLYSFYGFSLANKDTLETGEYALSGTDPAWKDIWLCFNQSSIHAATDSFLVRFTLKSDTGESMKEGWMIDNMKIHKTITHTVAKDPFNNTEIRVFPNLTTGIVNIEAPKAQKFHIAERIAVMNTNGQLMKEYKNVPTKYYVDIGDLPNGLYYFKVKTNLYSGTYPVMLTR